MKITDAELIKNGEKELIDAITGDLDWGVIENIFKEKHHLGLQDDVEYRQGDIVVYDKKVAYKLQFDVKVTLSILFDRNGEFLSLSTGRDEAENELDTESDEQPVDASTQSNAGKVETLSPLSDDELTGNQEDVTQMASEIADMISDINKS